MPPQATGYSVFHLQNDLLRTVNDTDSIIGNAIPKTVSSILFSNILIDTFRRSNIGQMTSGYETCQDNNIYNVIYFL
jgi:hypothetical protein